MSWVRFPSPAPTLSPLRADERRLPLRRRARAPGPPGGTSRRRSERACLCGIRRRRLCRADARGRGAVARAEAGDGGGHRRRAEAAADPEDRRRRQHDRPRGRGGARDPGLQHAGHEQPCRRRNDPGADARCAAPAAGVRPGDAGRRRLGLGRRGAGRPCRAWRPHRRPGRLWRRAAAAGADARGTRGPPRLHRQDGQGRRRRRLAHTRRLCWPKATSSRCTCR